jgi:O-antigen/teichoic acid export membrane protein
MDVPQSASSLFFSRFWHAETISPKERPLRSCLFSPKSAAEGPEAYLSDLGRRYVTAALQSGLGGIASRVFQGLAPILIARYLGPKEYGVYSLVLSLVLVAAGFAHLGQNLALQKFLPEYSVKDPARGGAILADTIILVAASLLIVFCLFFLKSGWIASSIYHDASLRHTFRFAAVIVLSMSLFDLASSVAAGLQDFRSYGRAMVVRSVTFVGLGWLGVWLWGLLGALAGQLAASLLGLAFLAFAVRRLAHQRFPGSIRAVFSRSVLAEIFSFGFPALLASLVVAPAYWCANTFLARSSGFEEVGLFGVAFTLAQLILVIPNNLFLPAISFMSEAQARLGPEGFSELVSTNLRIVWAVTLPLCLGCALASGLIVRIFFGSRYSGASALVLWLSFAALLIAVCGQIGAAIASLGHMWQGFALNGLWFALFLGLALLLIPAYGSRGLAASYLVSYALFSLAVWQFAARFLKIHLKGIAGVTLLSSLCFALGCLARPWLGGTRGVLITCAAEGLLLWAEWSWILDEAERKFVIRVVPWRAQNA